MEATYHKVKLTKEGTVKASYSFFDASEARVESEALHHRLAHPDLQKAFDRMRVHMCFIMEMVRPGVALEECREKRSQTIEDTFDTGLIYGADSFEPYSCNQVILPPSGGIMFSDVKHLLSGKQLNLNSPLAQLHPDMESYPYLDQLNQDLVIFLDEVAAYMDGKSAGGKQLDMFEPVAEAQVILLEAHEQKMIGSRSQYLIGNGEGAA